jgi:cyanophycin synthetase
VAELKHLTAFHGPSPYARSPVVVAELRLDPELEGQAEAFCDRLRKHYPAWFQDFTPGNDTMAVELGRTAAHWALCALNEVRGYLHDAGATSSSGGAHVWVGFHDESASQEALELAFKVLLHGDLGSFSVDAVQRELSAFWTVAQRRHPDYQARILMQAARAADIPVRSFIRGTKYWQYGWGKRSRIFFECNPIENGGKRVTSDKILSKEFFRAAGAPAPEHRIVASRADLDAAQRAVGWPCVVKPIDANKGRGVTAGIRTRTALETAFEHARRTAEGSPIIVEAFVPGDDHRLLIANGKVIRAIKRHASTVIGDGRRRTRELIQDLNRQRADKPVHSRYLREIVLDEALTQHLANQSVSLDAVLPAGTRITLRSNANLSTGGDAADVTSDLHPDTRRMAELIAASMGLTIAGVDYITADIGTSYLETGAFIEINSNPGLAMTIASGNDPVEMGAAILGDRPGRIPLALVVMPDADLAQAGHWLAAQNIAADTGWACGRAAGIGGTPLLIANKRPWAAPEVILKNVGVGSAWFLCGQQELIRWGLPADHFDRVLVAGVTLSEAWQAVIMGSAKEVNAVVDWETAAKILLQNMQ